MLAEHDVGKPHNNENKKLTTLVNTILGAAKAAEVSTTEESAPEEEEEDQEDLHPALAKMLKETINVIWQGVKEEYPEFYVVHQIEKLLDIPSVRQLDESAWSPRYQDCELDFFFRALDCTTYMPTRRVRSAESTVQLNNIRRNLVVTTKYPSLYQKLENVAKVGKSHVPRHKMFAKQPVGRGLIAMRDLNKGDKLYTIVETDIDVKIVTKRSARPYEGFQINRNEVLVPLASDSIVECARHDVPPEKPFLYFLQHNDEGNVKVNTHYLPITYPLPTHYLPITYVPITYPLPTHCLPIAYP